MPGLFQSRFQSRLPSVRDVAGLRSGGRTAVMLAYEIAVSQLKVMIAEGCVAHGEPCNDGFLFGDRDRQVTSVDGRTDKDNSCYRMDCPRNQVSASDASRNKPLAVLTGLGKRFSPDWTPLSRGDDDSQRLGPSWGAEGRQKR